MSTTPLQFDTCIKILKLIYSIYSQHCKCPLQLPPNNTTKHLPQYVALISNAYMFSGFSNCCIPSPTEKENYMCKIKADNLSLRLKTASIKLTSEYYPIQNEDTTDIFIRVQKKHYSKLFTPGPGHVEPGGWIIL